MSGRKVQLSLLVLVAFACGSGCRSCKREAAVKRCRQARAQKADSLAEPGKVPRVIKGCADLWSQPACRKAWENVDENPEVRLNRLSEPCRRAYCPKLKSPKPKACDVATLPAAPSDQQRALLLPLWKAIAAHEFRGTKYADEIEQLVRAIVRIHTIFVKTPTLHRPKRRLAP